MVLRFAPVESFISSTVISSPGLGELQYLVRKGGQRRSQGLLFFDLCRELVFLLRHGFEEKHQPVFPVLLFPTDGPLGTKQREVIAVVVRLDDSFHGAIRNVSIPRTQQQKRR